MTLDEIKVTIDAEIEFLNKTESRFFLEVPAITVGMRAFYNQLINCWATTSDEHSMKMITRMATYGIVFLDKEGNINPRSEIPNIPAGLNILGRLVDNLETATYSRAFGDCRSHMMSILAVLTGMMLNFGEFDERLK